MIDTNESRVRGREGVRGLGSSDVFINNDR